jgi:hypothetical protein
MEVSFGGDPSGHRVLDRGPDGGEVVGGQVLGAIELDDPGRTIVGGSVDAGKNAQSVPPAAD